MKAVAVLMAAALLAGCQAAALTVGGAGAGVAMGTGVEQTMSGITYKTFAAPVADVRTAALSSLHRMDMKVTADASSDKGWKIAGAAAGRTIDVQLEKLTPKTTRMRVVVAQDDSIFFKDASTATEILLQTADTLDDQKAKAARASARRM